MTTPTSSTRPTTSTRQSVQIGDDTLYQIGQTPFYNTPPQIETNDCGQVHSALAYVCDLDFKDPTSYAEPEYKFSLNRCGVCVTIEQPHTLTETRSTTFCYVLPACRPKRPTPQPPRKTIPWDLINKIIDELPAGCGVTFIFGNTRKADVSNFGYELLENKPGVEANWFFPSNAWYAEDEYGNRFLVCLELWLRQFFDANGEIIESSSGYVKFQEDVRVANVDVSKGLGITDYRCYLSGGFNFPATSIQDALYRVYGNLGQYNWGLEGLIYNCPEGKKYWPPDEPEYYEPPDLPSPNPPDDMACCPQTNNALRVINNVVRANDELLRKIYKEVLEVKKISQDTQKKVKETHEVIAPNEYPAELPKRWFYPTSKGEVKAKNLPELLEYQFRMLDRLTGFFPFTVSIKDANPAQEGDQGLQIRIESISDALKQILQYLIDTEGDVDAVMNAAIRGLYETGLVHQITAVTDSKVQVLLDFINPGVRPKRDDLPMAFDPTAGNSRARGFGTPQAVEFNDEAKLEEVLPLILRHSKQPITIYDFNGKKNLSEWLLEINRNAANAAAGTTEKVSPGIIESLMEAVRFYDTMQRFLTREDVRKAMGVGDMSEWSAETEKQFPTIPDKFENKTDQAYNKPIGERPDIRQRKKRKRN